MSASRDIRLPAARVLDLIVTETGTDVLVYDETAQTIHTLNSVTASVWRALDGTKTPATVAAETGLGEETVLAAVSRLAEVSLVEGGAVPVSQSGRSRRAFLKKAGVATAIPVILSVSAPAAYAQVTGCTYPTTCEVQGNLCCYDTGTRLRASVCVDLVDGQGLRCLGN